MSTGITLWRVDGDGPIEVPRAKLDLESRLEDWLRKDLGLVNDDLLLIGQQVGTPYGGIIDLLALDIAGNLVVLELKRDRTSRDIVAQILDYASWVQELSHEEIEEISERYLGDTKLEDAFKRKFSAEFPEVLNESHRLYIVASTLDAATERIVRYLSESHDLDINVATFGYFQVDGVEVLGRTTLMDEGAVQTRAQSRSKRAPPRSWEEFSEMAEDAGVSGLYERAVNELRPLFDGVDRTRNNLAFVGRIGEGRSRNAIVGVYPGLSDPAKGLVMTLFLDRIEEYFGLPSDQLAALLVQEGRDLPTFDPDQTWYFDPGRFGALVGCLRRAKDDGTVAPKLESRRIDCSNAKAQQQSWAEAQGIAFDHDGYVLNLQDNFFVPMSSPTREEFSDGSGSELGDEGKRGKMHALHSSSALAVNVFEYWRQQKDREVLRRALELPTRIDAVRFERKFATGLGGPAHIDVVLGFGDGMVAIESKFLEPCGSARPYDTFSERYFPPAAALWADRGLPGCQDLAEQVYSGELKFLRLDVPQLLKHALGLWRGGQPGVSLWYLYLEMAGPVGELHKIELDRFREGAGEEVGFRTLSYNQLISRLHAEGGAAHEEYVTYLASRYAGEN